MVAELAVDNPIDRFADSFGVGDVPSRQRPPYDPQPQYHHRLRRVASRLPVARPSCRRPPAAVGAAVAPAPVSVPGLATRPLRGPSCGPRRVADRRAVYRRRRTAAVGGLAVVIVFCWMATRTAPGRIGGGPLATTAAPGGGNPAAVQVWTVRPGDTLWSIAEAVDPNGDVRPLVDSLAAEVGSTAIYPGEAIAIPGR